MGTGWRSSLVRTAAAADRRIGKGPCRGSAELPGSPLEACVKAANERRQTVAGRRGGATLQASWELAPDERLWVRNMPGVSWVWRRK